MQGELCTYFKQALMNFFVIKLCHIFGAFWSPNKLFLIFTKQFQFDPWSNICFEVLTCTKCFKSLLESAFLKLNWRILYSLWMTIQKIRLMTVKSAAVEKLSKYAGFSSLPNMSNSTFYFCTTPVASNYWRKTNFATKHSCIIWAFHLYLALELL